MLKTRSQVADMVALVTQHHCFQIGYKLPKLWLRSVAYVLGAECFIAAIESMAMYGKCLPKDTQDYIGALEIADIHFATAPAATGLLTDINTELGEEPLTEENLKAAKILHHAFNAPHKFYEGKTDRDPDIRELLVCVWRELPKDPD